MPQKLWPKKISLQLPLSDTTRVFKSEWKNMMDEVCRKHPVWQTNFVKTLKNTENLEMCFNLATVWSVNMVVGSYCFPRYVAALAARAEQDAVRHGLLENAWDESGSRGHTVRSHFWLAVRLAHLLGLSKKQIENIQPLNHASIYTDVHYNTCVSENFPFALGMLCLIEEFTTPEFTMILEAFGRSCQVGMGLQSKDFMLRGGDAYFTANIADDERHREEMPRLVATYLLHGGCDLNNQQDVRRGLKIVGNGARYSADLRQNFFEDIYRFVLNGGHLLDLISRSE